MPPDSAVSGGSMTLFEKRTEDRQRSFVNESASEVTKIRGPKLHFDSPIGPRTIGTTCNRFLAAHAIPGVEVVTAGLYARAVPTPSGYAVLQIRPVSRTHALEVRIKRRNAGGVAAVALVSSANVRPDRRSWAHRSGHAQRPASSAPARSATGLDEFREPGIRSNAACVQSSDNTATSPARPPSSDWWSDSANQSMPWTPTSVIYFPRAAVLADANLDESRAYPPT